MSGKALCSFFVHSTYVEFVFRKFGNIYVTHDLLIEVVKKNSSS